MKAKGIFFDLFGTLFVSHNDPKAWDKWVNAIYRNIKASGISTGTEELKELLDGFFSLDVPAGAANPNSFTSWSVVRHFSSREAPYGNGPIASRSLATRKSNSS